MKMKTLFAPLACAAALTACGDPEHALTSDSAKTADKATNADKAATADKATSADDAAKLGGQAPDIFATAADMAKKLDTVTVSAPLAVDAENATKPVLSIAKSSATADGYLAKADFAKFDGKQDKLSADGAISIDAATIHISTASATATGALDKEDFAMFAAKQGAITAAAPMNLDDAGALTIAKASGSANGYLASADFTVFAAKQNALTFGAPLAVDSAGKVTAGNASATADGILSKTDYVNFGGKQSALTVTAPLALGSDQKTLSIPAATTSVDGFLSKTDWATFNGKAPATGSASYIQNGTAAQAATNFNIGGNGVIGGTLGVTGALTLAGTTTVNATMTIAPTPATAKAGFRNAAGRIISSNSTAPVDCAAAAIAATVTQVLDAALFTCATSQTLTLPTMQGSAGIVQNLPGTPAIGDIFEFSMVSAANTFTLAAGAGATIYGSAAVSGSSRRWRCRLTSVTAGAETATCY